MKRLIATACFVLAVAGTQATATAAGLSEQDLMRVAADLGHRYDASFAARDPAAMAMLYTEDGVLVSPFGPIVRGREALRAYYVKRFASGASGHVIDVLEVHVLGDGGYGINRFSVVFPGPNGTVREVRGTIVAVYRRDKEGWHMSLAAPNIPQTVSK